MQRIHSLALPYSRLPSPSICITGWDRPYVRCRTFISAKNGLGIRVTLQARITTAKINLQIDIGFGDAVTPEMHMMTLLLLLLLHYPPADQHYPRETVVAEKVDAALNLGTFNIMRTVLQTAIATEVGLRAYVIWVLQTPAEAVATALGAFTPTAFAQWWAEQTAIKGLAQAAV